MGLNINISQRTRLLFTVMAQFCFIKVILLQFKYAYREKYIVFRVAGWNVIISDIRSKASYMRHVNMHKI